jgi:hypothetical protein
MMRTENKSGNATVRSLRRRLSSIPTAVAEAVAATRRRPTEKGQGERIGDETRERIDAGARPRSVPPRLRDDGPRVKMQMWRFATSTSQYSCVLLRQQPREAATATRSKSLATVEPGTAPSHMRQSIQARRAIFAPQWRTVQVRTRTTT